MVGICKPTEKRNSVIAKLTPDKKIRCDKCIRHLLESMYRHGFETVASCCGHGIYPLTIVCKSKTGNNRFYEVVSGKEIPRIRNFYKLDSKGFYYISETILNHNSKEMRIPALRPQCPKCESVNVEDCQNPNPKFVCKDCGYIGEKKEFQAPPMYARLVDPRTGDDKK